MMVLAKPLLPMKFKPPCHIYPTQAFSQVILSHTCTLTDPEPYIYNPPDNGVNILIVSSILFQTCIFLVKKCR